jgi:hypothetical protein
MPAFRLILADGPANAVWSLHWDEALFVLEDPDGQPELNTETARVHHEIDLSMAFIDGTVAISTPRGKLLFKRNDAAIRALKELVAAGLRLDPEYRAKMLSRSRYWLFFGAGMFVVATGLFVVFCWYISWAPDPPPDSWLHMVRRVIKYGVAVLMAVALLGFGMCIAGVRTLFRIRAIERDIRARDAEDGV